MINIHAQTFHDFSHADLCNRHLLSVAISALVLSAAAFVRFSNRVNINFLNPIQCKLYAKRIFTYSSISLVIGGTQWIISIKHHTIATYDRPASNSVPYRSRSKASQLFQDIASSLIVPWGLVRLVHYFIGDLVNASSRGQLSRCTGYFMDKKTLRMIAYHELIIQQTKEENQLNPSSFEKSNRWTIDVANPVVRWLNASNPNAPLPEEAIHSEEITAPSYERASFDVNGCRMDGYFKYYSPGTTRWMFISLGTGGRYETILSEEITQASQIYQTNVLVYNPLGIGDSTGIPTRENLVAGYTAIFLFLQNDKKATEIISFGISLGGMIQGMAHRQDILSNPRCKTILIEDRGPTSIVDALNGILAKKGPLANHPSCGVRALSYFPAFIPQGVVWMSGWNLKAASPSDPMPPQHVTRMFLHCQEMAQQQRTDHFIEAFTKEHIEQLTAGHEGLLRKEDTCGYQMRSLVHDHRHRFFLTGGTHFTVDDQAFFNPAFANVVIGSFQNFSY